MNGINFVSTIVTFLVTIIMPIITICFLYKKKILKIKYIFCGVLFYLVIHILLFPVISSIFSVIGINMNILYIKLILQFIYLAILCIFIKKQYYGKILKLKENNVQELICLGCGEAISEILFLIFPTILNQMCLKFMIQSGSIYSFFEKTHTREQIDQVIQMLNDYPVTYYIYIIFVVVAMIMVHVFISEQIMTERNEYWLISIGFYLIYVIVSIISYPISCVLLVTMILFLYKKLKKEI